MRRTWRNSTQNWFVLNACLPVALFLSTGAIRPDMAVGQELSPEAAEVLAVAESLFQAMRTNDGALAASVFHPDARMGRATPEGISFRSPDGFVEMVGQAKDDVWDEPIWDYTIQVDGRLAQMWTRYAFYLNDEFSHCGVDAFEFYKTEDGWKIVQLIDTMRRDDCWLPPGR